MQPGRGARGSEIRVQHLGRYEVMWGPEGRRVQHLRDGRGPEGPGGMEVQNLGRMKGLGSLDAMRGAESQVI